MGHKVALWSIFIPAVFLLSQDALSKKKLKVEGSLVSEAAAKGTGRGEAGHEFELELKTKRKEKTKIEVSLKAWTEDDEIALRKAFFDYRLDEDTKIQFGANKKRFGAQYQYNNASRYTNKRHIIYRQKLAVFSWVGYETSLRYLVASKEDSLAKAWDFTIGYTESQEGSLMAHLHQPLDSEYFYELWSLVQVSKKTQNSQIAYGLVAMLAKESADRFWQWETAGGKDPVETEFEVIFNNGQPIHFLSTRVLTGWRFSGADKAKVWEPMMEFSAIVHDTGQPTYNTLQCLLGIRFRHGPLMIGFNVDGVAANSRTDAQNRLYDESSVSVLGRYDF
ncbi:MAG: hypothetical protein CMP10_16850 [Zetaproteobacteria bacterium]|nr:hypothetical protein [Pseudobdellovibrionaceae bacterium]|tara:strand:+ start:677 stop:1681 length:1005 start_codon:yes stop_codon:yes gene_type:complete